ncbi:T9SS type A sorting domain-containing protein [uncultured Psychroserpens sp.]|uniref:T9SS type A sorting domain-containing protein n=1 Tax=uncultured Psychroserpens sp. TaxID=255436 RepID=UPI00261CD27E|nr:T9SS type A sorting domain-containing protein [uncultured Psychroserpens sp.]
MSNFTRSGRRAKIWQSITNLSCCSIDLMTKQSRSMKALVFIMLFAFSTTSVFAQQDLARSTFFNRCQDEAPPGPTEADVANLYMNQCGDLTAEVVKSTLMEGNDCAWNVEYTYDVKCGAFEEQIKISYNGGDITVPELNDGAEVPTGGQDLNLCFSDAPAGPSADDIALLYSDNCSEVFVTKSGAPEGNDCQWEAVYTYTIKDACDNFAEDLVVTYSGGDDEAPQLAKGAELPTDQYGINLCFDSKSEGPTAEDIAALFEDNCGNVNVTKSVVSKGDDCKWMAEFTYTIQDDCNNFAESVVVAYYGGDLEDPVLSGVPGDITVDCVDQVPAPAFKEVSATDNCADKLEVQVSDNPSELDSCLGGVIVRTYSVVDGCGNSDSQTQTITVLPTPEATVSAPEFPSSITCAEAGEFQADDASFSNGVDGGACAISGSIQAEVDFQYTECGGTITVTYDDVDACERPLSAGPFVINVEPAPMAEFDGVEDMTVSCDEAGSIVPGSLGYSNGAANPACLIEGSVEGELSGSYTECGGTLYIDWVYTDDCDRTITAKKTITVEPAPMAEIVDGPGDIQITCEDANGYQLQSLNYSNGASNEACLIEGSVEGELSGTYDECGGDLLATWTFVDECGRELYYEQFITVLPAPMAEFDEVEDMTISCDEAGSFQAGSLGYSNGAANPACLIEGSVEGELSGSYTECGGTLYVDWVYTDDCDRTITAKKTITVEPAPMAEFDEIEDMTVSCDEAASIAAGFLAYSNGASTEACLIAGEVEGELSGSYDECGGTLTINWTYTDECQRTIEASKTITVEPAPMAEFEPVDNITVSCDEAASITAGSLGYSNGASTEACLIEGSVEGELSGEYDECGGLLYIDWTYTDDCERTITARQQIKVNPAPMAEFDEVEDMVVSCDEAASIEAGFLGYSNGAQTDACLIAGEVEGELSGSYTECGGTLEIDWTYTDECGRTITAKKTITVEPAPMAEFDGTEDMTISCDEAGSFQAGSLGYSNGASTEACLIEGSVEGEATPNYDECGGTIAVNWTYTDECGRTITASKTVTVEPAPMAEFDEVEDMTVSCDEAGSIVAGSLGYSNGAANPACLIEGSVEGELSGSYTECGGTLYVDWVYTDDCDRTITAKKTITVEPAPMAEFDEVEDMTVSCDEAASITAGSLGYSNGASTEACLIEGSVEGELSGSYDECGGTLTINWTYTDECQRTIEASKTITVEPAPMAEFDEVEDMTVSCDEAASIVAGSLGYSNGASTDACLIEGSVEGELSGSYTECGGTLYIDWVYTDDCDRTITAKKTITVEPAPMAEFDEVEDMTVSCDEAASITAGSLGYSNGASTEACLIAGEVEGELSGSYDECGGTLTINWTYTDECQRTIIASKTITVEPAPMAEFDEVEDMTISCDEAGSFQAGSLGYSNGASTEACLIAGEVEGELSGSYTECGGTLYVDWTYTDDCGRTITAKKTVTVEPAPMAEFAEVQDISITCDLANQYVVNPLSYTNGASTEACLIEGSVEGELSGEYDECGGTLYVDWTYTDDCNRTISARKTITVEPAPMAEFDEVEDMTISCDEAGSFQAGSLGYSNGALNPACLIEGSVEGELSGSYTECGGTLFVDWTYTDDCGRTITAKKEITVEPAPMAEFDEVEDMTISCDEAGLFQAGSLGYSNGALTEACLIEGSVPGEATPDYDECGGVIIVNWTYTDDCQRTITASKTVTVEPAPMAEFDEVEDMTVSCDEAASITAGSLGYSNGALNPACLIEGSVEGELSGSYTECGGTLYIDWTYTDDCDRTITAKKTITVEPAPMAEFDEVEDMTISCDEAGSFQAGSLGYSNGASTEACLIEGSVPGEATPNYDECGGTITVNWTYTDDCNRTIDASQTITVEPAPMAEFDEVEDMTISCDEAGSFQAGSLGYSNGALNPACLIEGSVEGELSGSYTECGGTLYVDWTYTDDCGRTITAKKDITVEPAPMAEFDEVEDMTISCDEAGSFQAGSLGYSNGASTEACLIEGSVEGELSGSYTECGGTLYVDWTYTDDCGRTITAKKEINVEPAPMAEFDEVEDMTISCDEAGSFQAGSLGYSNGALTEACLIEGSVPGEATPDYDECGGVIIVNWTYTDDCQRTITASKTVTVEPAPMAEFDEVEDMTVSCDEAASITAGSLGYSNGALNPACLIEGSVEGELSGSYTECGGTLYVDWTYTDDCGRTITAKKEITVEPAPMAEFDEVEDMTISCDEAGSFQAGSLGYSNGALTEACLIEGSVPGEATPDYDECGGVIIVNWTYTDDCQRTITASKTVTVEPAPMAEFDEVEDMTVSCDEAASITAGSLGYSNGALNPACLIEGSVEGELSGSYTECGGTLYVDWTYTDDCGRTITAKKEITVEPAPMAMFNPVQDDTISCEEANVFQAASLGYSNGASTEACLIEGSVPGEATPNYDECGGTITVNWTYTDDCNRTIDASQTITVEPAPMAEFDEILDASIPCEELSSYEPEFLSYSNEGTGACLIEGSVQGEAQPFDGSCGTFEVDFTYTDDCGRTITAKQTITVVDETAPMLVGEYPQGESDINACFADAPAGPTEAEIAALFEDNCGNVNVTKSTFSPDENNDCQWAIVYRYDVEDDCGNMAAPVKIAYNGGDNSAPELVGDLPQGVTGLQCLSENPGAPSIADIEAAYTDNCGEVTVTALEPVIEGDDCGWTATYTYTVQDSCENFADNVVIVNSGADTQAPELEGELPPNVVNSINACKDADLGEPSAEEIAALYVDNCSEVTVEKIEKLSIGSDCEWIRVYEYIAKDACGTPAELFKITYSGGDMSAPEPTGVCDDEVMTIEGCPETAEISLQIGDEISIADRDWTVGGFTLEELNGTLGPCFTDNCALPEELTFRVIGKGVDKGVCSTTLTVTFEVEDNCENVSEPFTCTFIVEDTTGPAFNEELPQDMTIECGSDIPEPAVLTATDDCSDATVEYIPEVSKRECKADDASNHTLWIANKAGLGVDSKNWTATGPTTFEQFSDGTAKLTGTTANVSNPNKSFEFVAWFKGASTYDEWTSTPNAASSTGFRQPKLDAGTTNGASLADAQTWTYYLMDETKDNKLVGQGDLAGVELSLSHNPANLVFGLQYGHKASLQSDGLGVSTWIRISGDYNGSNYYSNGDFNVALSECVEDPNFDIETEDDCNRTIVRTWIAKDACGNETTHTQTITVSDSQAPVIDCPQDVDFGHVYETPTAFADKAPYTDNCSADGQTQEFTDSEITETQGEQVQVGSALRLIFGDYILDFGEAPHQFGVFTDYFGNIISDDVVELVYNSYFNDYDIVYHGLGNVGFVGLDLCNSTWNFFGDHNKTFTVECAQFEYVTEYSFTRTFTATDDCGNVGECSVEYSWSTGGVTFRESGSTNYPEFFGFEEGSRDQARQTNLTIDFTAYPVPFDKEVNIAYSFEFDTNVTIELFDTKGLLILSETNSRYVAGSKDKATFDLSRISNQMFYVKVTTSQGSVTKKIVSSGKK